MSDFEKPQPLKLKSIGTESSQNQQQHHIFQNQINLLIYLMMLIENVLLRVVKEVPELERAMMELMEEHSLNSIVEPNKD